jgi:hypothetical protein
VTLPRPPWDFHLQGDEQKFKTWLNQQLDAPYETWSRSEIIGEVADDALQDAMVRAYVRHLQRERVLRTARQLQRGRMSRAARNRELQALQQLTANDQELKDLALQEFAHHRERGRERGDPRPRDLAN